MPSTQKYSVNQQFTETILAWYTAQEIAVPETISSMTIENYKSFLEQRRILISKKIKEYYLSL
jgi:hypothetical protein